ncbi:MAG TPA: hypothetical protein DIT34_03370, partial [Acinetobacter ursingii]|nr:hypothetical protein [Acinetobacter ursingii]
LGAWRLRAVEEDEEDDENEQQRIRIEPIFDADSCVFFDLDAKRQDKADAKFCFVLSSMTYEAYIDEYEDDPTSWDKSINNTEFDWCGANVVYLAEYYVKEKVKEKIHIFRLIDGTEQRHSADDLKENPDLVNRLQATGAQELRIKTTERIKVRKYLLSGSKILEDYGYLAGKHIPIVPVYGKRWFVDNVERCMGHVRLCKDAQRLKNMLMSRLGEISAQTATEKPILTPEQIAGFEHMWAEDNITNNPYLLINPMTDASGQLVASAPTAYTKPPQIPPALAALLQVSEQDIKDVLGNQENGEKIVANISAEAIDSVQNQLGLQSYIYISNMAKGIRRSGEIWLSMARELYIEEGRTMKVVGRQDEVDSVELARPMMTDDGLMLENDLTKASFDLAVDVGPTSSSKRSATVRALTTMLPLVSPDDQPVISAMIMMNMEGEGIKETREYYRKKLVQMGVVKPTEEEEQQMMQAAQNQQPDPQSLYLQAAADEAQAKAQKAKADTVKVIVDAEKAKAETAETLARMNRDDQQAVLQMVQQLNQQMAASQPNMTEEQQNV